MLRAKLTPAGNSEARPLGAEFSVLIDLVLARTINAASYGQS
ncbi:hypothetical protein [Variovorax sp. GT1P44]